MATRLEDAIAAIQAKVAGLTPAIRSAPAQPPENTSAYPFGVTYAGRVAYTQDSQTRRTGLITAIVEIHVARKDLPRDIVKALPYGETLPVALWNDTSLGGVLNTPGPPGAPGTPGHINKVSGTFGPMEWGDQHTLGWRFEIDFKLMNQGIV